MPLESLPDVFDDATHEELDKAVNQAALDYFTTLDYDVSSSLIPLSQLALLDCIVDQSKGDLDPKYTNTKEKRHLISAYGELREMLVSAWERKSYREIRNLAILKNPSASRSAVSTISDRESERVYVGLSESFEAEYHGAAIEGFYEYLTENEAEFKKGDPAYYAKFCSIVQSSGTGKSRLLTELYKKDVVVIYMNLRSKTDVRSFPARDEIPANILTEFPANDEAYRLVCYAFFTALFEVLAEQFCDTKENVMQWARQMCDVSHVPKHTTRSDFFGKVLESYKKIHDKLVPLPKESSVTGTKTATSDVEKATEGMAKLALSDPPFSMLAPVYHNLGAAIKRIFPDGAGVPRVVIAIDEAHPLAPSQIGYPGGYRPADILCRIISKYSHDTNNPIWVVFASTTSKVADFSPPNEKHNSERVARKGQQLFPPYTQLGWDQSATALEGVPVEEVSKLSHIASYGRPLWRSLMTALKVRSEVISTASSKLCGGEIRFDPGKVDHVLAVLGQRFALSVSFGHPESVGYLETGIASYLRICLATTLDRRWRFTSYPSEPLLSCVAAEILHKDPNQLDRALENLLRTVNRGMIDMGERGELASRLLWLIAKDLYVRTSASEQHIRGPKSLDGDLLDCKMIPVVGWLEFVFGPRVWDEGNKQTPTTREIFENAYVNFSHWVCMDANINGSRECNELDLDELTQRHWQRTSGVQCCHLQPLVDKMIPLYFKRADKTTSAKSRMSQIFIQDKAKQSTDSKALLGHIARGNEHLSGRGKVVKRHDPDVQPYIAIMADLGQPPAFSVTFPARSTDDPCMRIYAGGVDTTTYPFLENYPKLTEHLQILVQLQQRPEMKKPYTNYLDAQVKIGSTATPRHMRWEEWKTVPKSPRELVA